tara:strand:+ start:3020 stop:3556 length:537 start_codon:yes stop_codon:yes gene_type:complete
MTDIEVDIKMSSVYRFNFDPLIVDLIKNFSKIHQYDDIESYKEAWKLWLDEYKDEINRETERLLNLGYNGNVIDKLYKSGRYYFRYKSTNKSEPKKRRQYISIDYNVIANMDTHINNNIKNENFTPAYGYDEFCKAYIEELKNEIIRLKTVSITLDKDDLINKIKKTYKNRYFIISHK